MQSKILATIFFVISLIALTMAATLFFQAKQISLEAQKGSKDTVPQLLKELSDVMQKPGSIIDDVNDFLVQKFGPCWGIPEGQCRE